MQQLPSKRDAGSATAAARDCALGRWGRTAILCRAEPVPRWGSRTPEVRWRREHAALRSVRRAICDRCERTSIVVVVLGRRRGASRSASALRSGTGATLRRHRLGSGPWSRGLGSPAPARQLLLCAPTLRRETRRAWERAGEQTSCRCLWRRRLAPLGRAELGAVVACLVWRCAGRRACGGPRQSLPRRSLCVPLCPALGWGALMVQEARSLVDLRRAGAAGMAGPDTTGPTTTVIVARVGRLVRRTWPAGAPGGGLHAEWHRPSGEAWRVFSAYVPPIGRL